MQLGPSSHYELYWPLIHVVRRAGEDAGSGKTYLRKSFQTHLNQRAETQNKRTGKWQAMSKQQKLGKAESYCY